VSRSNQTTNIVPESQAAESDVVYYRLSSLSSHLHDGERQRLVVTTICSYTNCLSRDMRKGTQCNGATEKRRELGCHCDHFAVSYLLSCSCFICISLITLGLFWTNLLLRHFQETCFGSQGIFMFTTMLSSTKQRSEKTCIPVSISIR
jgi:hypothetical protein